jgi:chemotaxis regulatin CheY-phosphate phosphatase CheZ
MTFEERLHNVIQLLEAAANLSLRNEQAIKKVVELQEVQSSRLTKMAEAFETAHNSLAAGHNSLVEAHNHLVAEIAGYVTDSRERQKQMEANLDALIRIITAEHSNGKEKP